MSAFTLWPADTPIFEDLTAGSSKSSTLVQFAIGACMLLIRHLVQRLVGIGGIDTGRALMIGNLVPALEGLLTAFGGVRLGIGSTSPNLLLESGRRRELPVVSPLTWKGTEDISSRAHSVFDLREETAMGMAFVSGCMVLAMLAGAWTIRARTLVTKATDAKSSPLISVRNFYPGADGGSKTGTRNVYSSGKGDARPRRRGGPAGQRHSEPHDDERKHDRASDSDDDSDDDDPPPPPPGPGTGLRQDDDTGRDESMGWKHLGVNFLLGYLIVAMLKGLRRLKTKGGDQRRHNGFGIDEQIGGSGYEKVWDILEGTYGFSRSKSNVDMTAELAGDFRITVRSIPFSKAIPSANSAQNRAIPACNPRQKVNWAGLRKIKTAVTVVIQICLEKFLEMFGLVDFAVLVVMPLIIAVLRYRYDEQEADNLLTEANELAEIGQSPAKRREDDEDFVYLNQRPSAPPSVLANGNNPEQIDISTPWSSPRRRMERCATHYSDLSKFIARHACELGDLDGNSERDVCVSTTEEGDSSEVANVELAHDTSRSLVNYTDETVTELTCFGSGDIAKDYATETDPDSEWSYGEDFEMNDGEFEDVEELVDELSDVESYVTAEGSDVEIEMEIHDEKLERKANGQGVETESLYEPSQVESVMYIDDNSTDDEFRFPTRSFPGSFPMIPLWGTRRNRWSIFAQFEELRGRGPFLAFEAIDFGLPRSNPSLVESQASVAVDSFRNPPQANTKTLYQEERSVVDTHV